MPKKANNVPFGWYHAVREGQKCNVNLKVDGGVATFASFQPCYAVNRRRIRLIEPKPTPKLGAFCEHSK